MLFSVIVPVYNTEKFLDECVQSILAQTFTDFECILVDDGSTDGSPAICDKYAQADSRIRVIHKQNGGVTSARLAGAQAARGEYVCCVDADDYLDKDYFVEFDSATTEYKPDIIRCGMTFVYGVSESVSLPNVDGGYYDRSKMESEILPKLIESKDMTCFASSVCGTAVRTDIFLKVQHTVDCSIRVGEDGACIKSCLFLAESVFVIRRGLYRYRQQSESVTHKGTVRNFDEPKKVCAVFDKWIDFSVGDLSAQRDRYIAHSLFNVCVSQFNRKDKSSVIKRDIKECLRDDFYASAIKRVRFDALKGKIIKFTLKHKSIFLLRKFHKRLEKKKRGVLQ